MTDQDVVITDDNFHEYFFDVRQHDPERGQIIAQYSATAEFVDAGEKRQIIALLRETDKMVATTQVMRKLLFATERDAYRIPREMAEDMKNGMSADECAAKPYKYTVEMYFYTKPEYVPKDDPHWTIISIKNLDDFLDKKDNQIKSRILKVGENDCSGRTQNGEDT